MPDETSPFFTVALPTTNAPSWDQLTERAKRPPLWPRIATEILRRRFGIKKVEAVRELSAARLEYTTRGYSAPTWEMILLTATVRRRARIERHMNKLRVFAVKYGRMGPIHFAKLAGAAESMANAAKLMDAWADNFGVRFFDEFHKRERELLISPKTYGDGC